MQHVPEEDHSISARELCRIHSEEIGILRILIEKLDLSLFGGDGREGILDKLEERIRDVERKVENLDRRWWIAFGIILALQFLSGSGIISLKGLINK